VFSNLIISIALTTHIGLHDNFNNFHPHAQYQLPNNYITGVYHNSDKRAGIYFGKRTKYKQLDIEYGLVHGYKRIDIAPMIKVNYGNVFVAPAATEDDVGLVAGYEVKF